MIYVVRKSNPSEFQILFSESPIGLSDVRKFNPAIEKEIALSYEFEVLTSDGLDFLIPLYQKVKSIRKSKFVLSLL